MQCWLSKQIKFLRLTSLQSYSLIIIVIILGMMSFRKASMDRVECHSSIGVSGVGISALAFCPEVTASMAHESIPENDAPIRSK